MGYILLAGGAEFSGRMAKPDRRAIELAGGLGASIRIIPAAAAPDNNHQRAGKNGVNWFKKLGAVNVAESGAVIAGSSAGAMIFCEYYYDPYEKGIFGGLGLIPNACILPHHDTFGKSWAPELAQRLPGAVLIGIDEQTGMLNDGPDGRWQVYGDGPGGVTLYKNERQMHLAPGTRFDLKF
jgi:cyanophycinase